jgi:hypothetical protein
MSNKLIGIGPNQVPSNADLGTMAYQDSKSINVSNIKSETLEIKPEVNKQGYALVVKTNHANNPIAMSISDATLLNGIAFSQQAFTPLCVGRDSGSTFSAFFNGRVAVAAGYGINFGATSSSPSGYTINNNTMEDYEEGSWTPVFHADSGSTGTSSTTVFGANYTKVGNLVTANCHVRWANQGSYSASGNVTLGGLPFTSYGSGSRYSGSYSMLKNIENPDTLPFAITVIKGTNYIYFSRQISDLIIKDGAKASYWNNNLNENAISITYQTA